MNGEIWILASLEKGSMAEETYGLVAEAWRLRGAGGADRITVLVPGGLPGEELPNLGSCGVDRVLILEGPGFAQYDGEFWARKLSALTRDRAPYLILMAHNALTEDLGPRWAASLEAGFLSRACDLWPDPGGLVTGLRAIANGHLFEEVEFLAGSPFLVSFLPSILTAVEKGAKRLPEIESITAGGPAESGRVNLLEVIAADPESAALEDAEIIVSGGRGVGSGAAFQVVWDLARALGGSVAGTRPVIDWQTLPFERQIGQTGKTVTPRLLIACGLSGANEFTAGMEKSQQVIAINTDPRARIFQFADLGVVGDVHVILPRLAERIEKEKHGGQDT
ncbi:MAG: electron transfer flavoprotein subunit alpha/FixB family protein [Desulfobacterota bacterium]|nr:electron transfer flavoprotein subunit alpha/FixB family protein [Thermodesulfobacteriota bacterium]